MKLTILLLVSIAFGALMAYASFPSVRWGMRNYFANRRERRLASQRERTSRRGMAIRGTATQEYRSVFAGLGAVDQLGDGSRHRRGRSARNDGM